MWKIKQFGKDLLRNLMSQTSRFKFIPPPTQRENGISLTIRVKNEIDWIEYCLLSFMKFSDEIIIADNGSIDGTTQVIEEFIHKHPEADIKFFNLSKDTYLQVSNFVLNQTKYRWIMRVDADHIAKDHGKYNIMKLRNRILQLDPKYYYAIALNHVRLYLDLFHSFKDLLLHKEFWLYTYSPDLICYREGKHTDRMWFPLYYRTLEFNEPFVFHLNIRNKNRLLERRYWGPWRSTGSKIPLYEFIQGEIEREFSTTSFEEAAKIHLKDKFKEVIPYNPTENDGYPDVLRPLLEKPRYKLIYDENGVIIDRIEP